MLVDAAMLVNRQNAMARKRYGNVGLTQSDTILCGPFPSAVYQGGRMASKLRMLGSIITSVLLLNHCLCSAYGPHGHGADHVRSVRTRRVTGSGKRVGAVFATRVRSTTSADRPSNLNRCRRSFTIRAARCQPISTITNVYHAGRRHHCGARR